MYTWMDEPNAEIWGHDCFETIQECIEDAKENYGIKPGEKIYVGECLFVGIAGYDLSDVLCRIEEDMYEQVGEVSEGWDISSTTETCSYRKRYYEKYNAKFRQLVLDYLEDIGESPNFYKIINKQEMVINNTGGGKGKYESLADILLQYGDLETLAAEVKAFAGAENQPDTIEELTEALEDERSYW